MMLRTLNWAEASAAERQALFTAPEQAAAVVAAAAEIVESVRRGGAAALAACARQFDGWTRPDYRLSEAEIDAAFAGMGQADREAIAQAADAVRRFHEPQGYRAYTLETWPGVTARRRVSPIGVAGLYVPAGSAPLVSTLVMLAAPAQLAGVPRIVVCAPPRRDGRVDPGVLAAARLLGLTEIYALGGAQAVAALAFGVGGLPRADKIFGPGNAYVAAAKAYVSRLPGGPATDLPAGPSEVMVIADDQADPDFVAADLLAQAEHDRDARVALVCLSKGFRDAVFSAVQRRMADLPRREIAEAAMAVSTAVICRNEAEAVEAADMAAPEHLIVQTSSPERIAGRVSNAGSIFLGPWTPEAAGDYAAGPNHVLPTGGAARGQGGVTVESFQKTTTLLQASAEGARSVGMVVERLAALEGLEGHASAMRVRRERAERGV